MKKCLSVRARTVVSSAACCIFLSSCVSRELFTGYHGVVYDSTTGRPMDGVYVMAEYLDGGTVIFGHSSVWCVKTRGMYTDKDGKFSFPGSNWQPRLHAIKLGFFEDRSTTSRKRRANGGDASGPPYDLYMTPQALGDFKQSGYVNCYRATRRRDILPNLEYLKIQSEEERLYRGDSVRVDDRIRRLKEFFNMVTPSEDKIR